MLWFQPLPTAIGRCWDGCYIAGKHQYQWKWPNENTAPVAQPFAKVSKSLQEQWGFVSRPSGMAHKAHLVLWSLSKWEGLPSRAFGNWKFHRTLVHCLMTALLTCKVVSKLLKKAIVLIHSAVLTVGCTIHAFVTRSYWINEAFTISCQYKHHAHVVNQHCKSALCFTTFLLHNVKLQNIARQLPMQHHERHDNVQKVLLITQNVTIRPWTWTQNEEQTKMSACLCLFFILWPCPKLYCFILDSVEPTARPLTSLLMPSPPSWVIPDSYVIAVQ